MVSDEMRNFMRLGSALMQQGKFTEALPAFEKALAIDPNHFYAVYGRTYCLSVMIGQSTGAEREALIDRHLADCAHLIELIDESILQPQVQDHIQPRDFLRMAYNGMAWYGLERARSDGEVLSALELINHALSLTTPLEEERMLWGYMDTKVRILLRLGRKEEAWGIVKQVLAKDENFSDFADFKTNPEYLSWAG